MSSQLSSDNVDYSNQNMTEFPTISKQNLIIRINVKNNKLLLLPNLSNFSVLRVLDLSHNRFVDLSPVSAVISLRELDCSDNRIVSLSFAASLTNLEVLRASRNRISTVAVKMPPSLIDVDISHNEIVNLDFIQLKFPTSLQRLDVSANSIDEVIAIRAISVLPQLHTLNVDLYEKNKDIQLLAFAKYLCPSLVLFDNIECTDISPINFTNDDILLDILVRGNENELRSLIQNVDKKIVWDEPAFIKFEEELPSSPLQALERKLQNIEQKLPALRRNAERANTSMSHANLFNIDQMNQDIGELRNQISVLSHMLFVHEQAMKNMIAH